jgi:hypothetical protein
VHCTQSPLAESQTVGPTQVLVEQEALHVCVAAWHFGRALGQSASAAHSTQVFSAVSQARPLPRQSLLVAQPAQTAAVESQCGGGVPPHIPSFEHLVGVLNRRSGAPVISTTTFDPGAASGPRSSQAIIKEEPNGASAGDR